jgi:protein-histidine pros-kinase
VTVDVANADCDVHVLADRQRLKQVLLNLMSNAIKYNRDGGSVRVSCHAMGDDLLRIEVADSGHGLAPDQVERLFRPFERLGAEVGSIEGTGIGLALSKGLIEAMGGTIGVESTLDVGSTFWVELALTPAATETHSADLEAPSPDPLPGATKRSCTSRTTRPTSDSSSRSSPGGRGSRCSSPPTASVGSSSRASGDRG